MAAKLAWTDNGLSIADLSQVRLDDSLVDISGQLRNDSDDQLRQDLQSYFSEFLPDDVGKVDAIVQSRRNYLNNIVTRVGVGYAGPPEISPSALQRRKR